MSKFNTLATKILTEANNDADKATDDALPKFKPITITIPVWLQKHVWMRDRELSQKEWQKLAVDALYEDFTD